MKNKKIKIIYILGELGFGGAERFTIDLIKNLDKQKFQPSLVCLNSLGPLSDELKKIDVPLKLIKKKTKLGLGAILLMAKYFRKQKPNIVHTQLFIGDTWGRIAAILAAVPVVVSTEQNVNADEGLIKHLIKWFLSLFTSQFYAISKAVQNYMIQKNKITQKKIKVVYNGLRVNEFKNNHFKLNTHKPIILNIGRLEKQKGQKYLIHAFSLLLKKYPQAELWIAGDGSLKNKLETEVVSLNIKTKVKFLGNTKNVPNLLKQVDIFVLPSLWEGLGVVLLEAMVSRKPVVASDIPAIGELIQNNQTGLLSKPTNTQDICQKIITYLENPALAEKISQQAQRFVLENFDIKKITKQYEESYLKLYESD